MWNLTRLAWIHDTKVSPVKPGGFEYRRYYSEELLAALAGIGDALFNFLAILLGSGLRSHAETNLKCYYFTRRCQKNFRKRTRQPKPARKWYGAVLSSVLNGLEGAAHSTMDMIQIVRTETKVGCHTRGQPSPRMSKASARSAMKCSSGSKN